MAITNTINRMLTSFDPNIKIVKKTSDILDVQVSKISYLLPLTMILGGFSFAIAGFVSILQKESAILKCKQLEVGYTNCNITRTNLLREKTTNFPQLTKAEIETKDYEDKSFYKINLLGSEGKVSLTSNAIDSEFETREKIDQINNFLAKNNSNSSYLTVNYKESFSVYIDGLMFITVGSLIVFVILTYRQNTNYVFEREKNTLWRIEKNLFNTKKIFDSNLSDITEVIVIEEQRVDDNDQSSTFYHLVLKKRSSAMVLESDKIDENSIFLEEMGIDKNSIILKAEGIDNNKYTKVKNNIKDFLRIK